MSLNFFWFLRMIETVRKRFGEPRKAADSSTVVRKSNGHVKKDS
jgi:hypothetical protein